MRIYSMPAAWAWESRSSIFCLFAFVPSVKDKGLFGHWGYDDEPYDPTSFQSIEDVNK